MGKYFGTDGVRGANKELTPELAFKLGLWWLCIST